MVYYYKLGLFQHKNRLFLGLFQHKNRVFLGLFQHFYVEYCFVIFLSQKIFKHCFKFVKKRRKIICDCKIYT